MNIFAKFQTLSGRLEDFYSIPGYDHYVISKSGVVIDLTDNSYIKYLRSKAGYVHYSMMRGGKKRLVGRHRLLAITFIPEKRDIQNLVVNHKNGIPGDDRLENLEWCTYRENLEHASNLGLTTKLQRLLVRNAETGIVTEWPCFADYAKAVGCSKDTVAYRVKSDGQIVFPDKCQYKRYSSTTPWLIPTDIEWEIKRFGTMKPVMVKYVLSDDVLYFDKQDDLAKHLGIAIATMSQWLNKPGHPVWPGYVQVKYLHDTKPWRIVDDVYLERERNSNTRAVVVSRVGSLDARIFSSARECAEEMQLLTTTLNWRLKSNGNVIYEDGCRYFYYSDYITNHGSSPSRVTVK